MGRAYFDVSPEVMEDVLGLRVATKIYGAEWSFYSNCIRLYVDSPDLPDLIEGQPIPQAMPVFSIGDDDFRPVFIKWNGNES